MRDRATRSRQAGVIGLAVVALSIGGCIAPGPPPAVPVAIYGRNATPVDAWFAVQPVGAELLSIGFGPDLGVGCWDVPRGSQIVMVDKAPGNGPTNVTRVIATIDAPPDAGRREVWVDVAKDGSVAAGAGAPAWWPGGGCP